MTDTPARSPLRPCSGQASAGSLTGARWQVASPDEQAVGLLSRNLSIAGQAVGKLTARVLACRGLTDPSQARDFLSCDLAALHDPFAMRDMERAAALLDRALAAGAHIRIYGDYDVDGVCATAMLVRALQALDGNVDWYIPHRIDEGYGLNEDAIRQAHADGVALLITVDCGASSVAQVALARELGLEVIVTDHHRPGDTLPDAPVLDPWRPDCGYPFKDLSGVGVAFKLVGALARTRGLPEGAELRFLDLVCLGTVADVVPLLGENRVLVHHGLEQLPKSRKTGITALLEAAGVAGQVHSRHVAFALAPRINAAGRMEHAQAAVRLLLTTDPQEARRLAELLSQQNATRREQERRILAEAVGRVAEEVDLRQDRVIVLASETWHPGVIGIVASRLVERYHRPVLLIAVSEGMGKGSGRSITGLNLWAALTECASLLARFGGHHYAAGFSIQADLIPALRERINEVASARLAPEDLVRTVALDGEAELDDLTIEAIGELDALAPFGMGNPRPLFVTRRAQVVGANTMGDGSHLALTLGRGEPSDRALPPVSAVWFRHGEALAHLPPGAVVDVCHRPRMEEWEGNLRLRLFVEDVGLSPGPVPPVPQPQGRDGGPPQADLGTTLPMR